MAVSRAALAAATGCMLVAGFSCLGISQALAQAASPDAQAPADMNAAPEDNEVANTAEAIRPFAVGADASVSELYDSNPQGLLQGTSDAITQGQVDVHLHDQTERFQGDLAYTLAANYHATQSNLNSIQNYLNALGHAEIWPEHLFFSARAFAQPAFLSRLGSLDAGNGTSSTANDRNSYGYVAVPDLQFRFDDFAQSDLSARQTGEFFSSLSSQSQGNALSFFNPTGEQSTSVSEKLKSGDYFGRMEWVLTASGTNSGQLGLKQLQRLAEADLEYHFDHNFGILGTGGYRKYDTRPALTRGLSGPIGLGGIDYNPDPSFRLIAKAGVQYNFTSYMGSLNYQFTPLTDLVATLDDTIATPQDLMISGLQGLSVTPGGSFFVPPATLPGVSALPGEPATSPTPTVPASPTIPASGLPINIGQLGQLALDNAISRYRTATTGLVHTLPRTVVSLTFYGTVRDYLLPLPGFSSRQTIYGGDLNGSFDLTRDITLTAAADYSVAREFGGLDKIGVFSTSLNYTISPAWSAFGRLNFLERSSRESIAFANGTMTDVQAGAGLRYTF
jgi:hypothetical protein